MSSSKTKKSVKPKAEIVKEEVIAPTIIDSDDENGYNDSSRDSISNDAIVDYMNAKSTTKKSSAKVFTYLELDEEDSNKIEELHTRYQELIDDYDSINNKSLIEAQRLLLDSFTLKKPADAKKAAAIIIKILKALIIALSFYNDEKLKKCIETCFSSKVIRSVKKATKSKSLASTRHAGTFRTIEWLDMNLLHIKNTNDCYGYLLQLVEMCMVFLTYHVAVMNIACPDLAIVISKSLITEIKAYIDYAPLETAKTNQPKKQSNLELRASNFTLNDDMPDNDFKNDFEKIKKAVRTKPEKETKPESKSGQSSKSKKSKKPIMPESDSDKEEDLIPHESDEEKSDDESKTEEATKSDSEEDIPQLKITSKKSKSKAKEETIEPKAQQNLFDSDDED